MSTCYRYKSYLSLLSKAYEGPGIIRKIKVGLSELLQKDGFHSVQEAVGIENYSFATIYFRYEIGKDVTLQAASYGIRN